ncbi:MAG: GDP-mannose 4,6-dehydratase [Gemmatimonadales bacterium]|nr:GDP-mannose 4,6-dehydratase [Gemmatimonadales bacterium]
MKVLVTGADGFVGRHLVRRLAADGHHVAAACRPGGSPVPWGSPDIVVLPLELTDDASVRAALTFGPEAVVHLAAVASNREAAADPGQAWTVNAAGTARLAEALARRREEGQGDARLLLISSGEVYGSGGTVPRRETDPIAPASPYAASKAGAELAVLEVWRRTGLPAVIARPFSHTGPGQKTRFVLPAFVERIREAKATGARTVPSGNLEPIRDLLDVRDVVEAYVLLLRDGKPGEIYNVARGEGSSVGELFDQLAKLIGVRVSAEADPSLARASDIPHLVGDPAKLRRATGWAPSRSLEQTLRGLVNAEAD